MKGGVSDCLVVGFDMAGDDKACLTVMRRSGRGYQVINTIFDTDAERLYEELTQKEKEAHR